MKNLVLMLLFIASALLSCSESPQEHNSGLQDASESQDVEDYIDLSDHVEEDIVVDPSQT